MSEPPKNILLYFTRYYGSIIEDRDNIVNAFRNNIHINGHIEMGQPEDNNNIDEHIFEDNKYAAIYIVDLPDANKTATHTHTGTTITYSYIPQTQKVLEKMQDIINKDKGYAPYINVIHVIKDSVYKNKADVVFMDENQTPKIDYNEEKQRHIKYIYIDNYLKTQGNEKNNEIVDAINNKNFDLMKEQLRKIGINQIE